MFTESAPKPIQTRSFNGRAWNIPSAKTRNRMDKRLLLEEPFGILETRKFWGLGVKRLTQDTHFFLGDPVCCAYCTYFVRKDKKVYIFEQDITFSTRGKKIMKFTFLYNTKTF